MTYSQVNKIVEKLRKDTRLYLPALTDVIGFSSARTEYLLNGLVKEMPKTRCYLEIGVLNGRTLSAVSKGNEDKILIGVDPCLKYKIIPNINHGAKLIKKRWQDINSKDLPKIPGVIFYDGDHGEKETKDFMDYFHFVDKETILVLDDWDRESVRNGAFQSKRWTLLREMPEYTDGLTTAPHHFGYYFGCSIWRYNK